MPILSIYLSYNKVDLILSYLTDMGSIRGIATYQLSWKKGARCDYILTLSVPTYIGCCVWQGGWGYIV